VPTHRSAVRNHLSAPPPPVLHAYDLPTEVLATLLNGLRAYEPLDADAILGDVGDARDPVLHQTDPALVERLRGHLHRLLDLAACHRVDLRNDTVHRLSTRGRAALTRRRRTSGPATASELGELSLLVEDLFEELVQQGVVSGIGASLASSP
jgi:hypothetical protein